MFGIFDKYIMVFLTGLVVSYCLTPWVRSLAQRFGVIDMPDERRPHQYPTARGGGVAVVVAVHVACLVALLFPWAKFAGGLDFHWWSRFALASIVLLVVGIVDDVLGMNPWIKLGGQVLAALLMWASGTRFGAFFGYQLPPALDCIFVVVWLVAIINAFNLIDGLDGLASGLAIISAIGLCGIFVINHLPANVLVLLGLIGACLGFLRYNFHPATVFLGDTGSMFLGFILGVVSLQTGTKNTLFLVLTIPMMVLGIPIYDALLAIWRRSVRRWLTPLQSEPGGHRGIMQPDLDHLHHRLSKAGLSTRRVAGFLYAANAALVLFGLLLTLFQSRAAGILLIALVAIVFVLMRHLASIEIRDTGTLILQGLRRPTHAAFKALSYPVWDMLWLAGAVAIDMRIFDAPRPDFWRAWFLDLPLWVTPTFSLLALSRTYVTVWTRARILDVLLLVSILAMGLFLSLGLALLIDPADSHRWLLRALILGGIAHPAILAMRLLYRSVEELVLFFKGKTAVAAISERVVLYGAGGRCQLYLKECGFLNSRSGDGRTIVGLIDDEPSLREHWVYGYMVLGGGQDLPRLIERHHIDRILVTTRLPEQKMADLHTLSSEHAVAVSVWELAEKELVPGHSMPGLTPPATHMALNP